MKPALVRAGEAEWLKLQRPRVLASALGALLGFTVLVTALTFATAKAAAQQARTASGGSNQGANTLEELATRHGLTMGFTNASRLIGMVVLVFFLTAVTSEYAFGTLRVLLLRQPRRGVILAAKLVARINATALALLLALGLSMVTAVVVSQARDLPTSTWFTGDGLLSAGADWLNAVLAAICFGAIGVALGVVVRSTAVAVGIALGWFVMLENIADNVWSGAADWLPGLLASGLSAGGTAEVSYLHSLLGAGAFAVLALSIASVVFVRRDVQT
jgi:ABC-type transport system involved in multi-copper enzyme maturation permease subunit